MVFDEYQLEAINCDSNAIVVATAGSGKTTTLIERVYQSSKQVPPKKIVCMSFTRDAVKQLRERLVNRSPELDKVTMRTIHSFSRNLLVGADPTIVQLKDGYDGKDKETGKFQKGDTQFLYDNVVSRYSHLLNKEVLDETEEVKRYIKLRLCRMDEHTDFYEDFEALYDKKTLEKMYAEYLEALRENKFITYDTMVYEALDLLRRNEELRNKVQDACSYLFIDEAQDLSRDQYELIKLITAKGRIFMVGDSEQAIYGFKGGMSELFLNAHRDFKDVKVLHLPINYRSSHKIVELGNKIAHTSDEADDINYMDAIPSNKSKCDSPKFHSGKNVTHLVVKQILEEYGRTPEMKLLCDYLKLIINHNDDAAFMKVYNKPTRYIGNVTVKSITDLATKRGVSLFEAMPYAYFKSQYSRDNATDFYYDIVYLSTHRYRNAAYAMRDLFRRINFEKAIEKMYAGDRNAQEEAMLNLWEFIGDADEYKTIQEYGREVIQCLGLNDDDGVVLSTVHKAKGLEWDSVIITDFNEGMFPHKRSTDANEEVHILYVAATRARKNLSFVSEKGKESPYLDIVKPKKKGA